MTQLLCSGIVSLLMLVVLLTAVPHLADGAGISSSGITCSMTNNMNVTAGVSCGPSKFLITSEDCCNYCASIAACSTAIFAGYYCFPYSNVNEVGPSSSALMLSRAVPTTTPSPPVTTSSPSTTTVAPATPVPITPSPSSGSTLAFLTLCPESIDCGDAVYICFTEVIPTGVCSIDDQHKAFVLATEIPNSGVERKQFTTSDCSGRPMSSVLYPFSCQYDSSVGSRVAFLHPLLHQPATYQASGDLCADDLCGGCPNISFYGPTGTCVITTGSPGSDSSSTHGATPGGYAQQLYCYENISLVVVFGYSSTDDCENNVPVVGSAWPLNRCYSNDATNRINSCAPTAPMPPPNDPLQYAFLISCPNLYCNLFDVYKCSTEVVPFGICSADSSKPGHHAMVQETSNGLVRLTYTDSTCRGKPVDMRLFPTRCEYDSTNEISYLGQLKFGTPQTNLYQATGSICTDDLCSACPTVSFASPTGTCVTADASSATSSESSASDSMSVGIHQFLCYESEDFVVVFSYASMGDCTSDVPVTGTAWPTSRCYPQSSSSSNYVYNLCSNTSRAA